MVRFLFAIVLFALAALSGWMFVAGDENLLFALGAVVLGLGGLATLVSLLFRKPKSADR